MGRQVSSARNRPFTVKIILPFDETVKIADVVTSMSILALKDRVELVTGIPRHLQRLTYFDDLDMEDNRRLSFFHVVPNSTFRMKFWPQWLSLIQASYHGDLKGVMASGIRQVIPRRGWFRQIFFNERGYVALFIASHRGHAKVVSRLMGLGIDACRKMPSGRSAIHVAVYKRRVTCVNLLVGKSRGIKDEQKYLENSVRRNTFQNIAYQLNRGDGWKLLVRQLKERKSRRENDDVFKRLVPLREFQKYDSTFSAYLKGPLGRIYLCTVLQMESFRRRPLPKPWK